MSGISKYDTVVVLHYKEKVALNCIGKKTVIYQKSLTLECL